MVRLKFKRIDLDLIRVGGDQMSREASMRIDYIVDQARRIFAPAALAIGRLYHSGISTVDANGYDTISSYDEAFDLMRDFGELNDALDVFFVEDYAVGDDIGGSPRPGRCNENGQGINGCVIGLNAALVDTVAMPHEIGHYLDLEHTDIQGRVMYPNGSGSGEDWTSDEAERMRNHCLVKDGCLGRRGGVRVTFSRWAPEKRRFSPNETRDLVEQASAAQLDLAERRHAIATLPWAAAETALPVLARIAQDESEDVRLRRHATSSLARINDPAVVSVMASLASDSDDGVATAALVEFGRGGSPEHLELLWEVSAASKPAVAKRARFAAAFIAYRFNVDGYDMVGFEEEEFLEPPSREHASLTTASNLNGDLARQSIAEAAPSLRLNGPAFGGVCGADEQVLLLTDEAASILLEPIRVTQRRWYIGQFAVRSPAVERYSPGLTVLTTPTGSGFRVGLYRSDGTLIYGGAGRVSDASLRAEILAVKRPGAYAVSARFVVSDGSVVLTWESDPSQAIAPRRPAPISTLSRPRPDIFPGF
jgi:hypothetical protein